MVVGLNDLPLELLVEITNYLSVKSCNDLAKVGPRLRAAVNCSLREMACHVQAYWREHDPKFEVIFERHGDEVLLARNLIEMTEMFLNIHSFKRLSIALDASEGAEARRRVRTFSLDFLKNVQGVEEIEWDCDFDVDLIDVPETCSKILIPNHRHDAHVNDANGAQIN
ncbi:hypothetical protein Q1695_011112 [Nippostrongylus brasiliensis]|nr:hypothetical protein Q1695_011112 [Nippostrongylus brasiliensis]